MLVHDTVFSFFCIFAMTFVNKNKVIRLVTMKTNTFTLVVAISGVWYFKTPIFPTFA